MSVHLGKNPLVTTTTTETSNTKNNPLYKPQDSNTAKLEKAFSHVDHKEVSGEKAVKDTASNLRLKDFDITVGTGENAPAKTSSGLEKVGNFFKSFASFFTDTIPNAIKYIGTKIDEAKAERTEKKLEAKADKVADGLELKQNEGLSGLSKIFDDTAKDHGSRVVGSMVDKLLGDFEKRAEANRRTDPNVTWQDVAKREVRFELIRCGSPADAKALSENLQLALAGMRSDHPNASAREELASILKDIGGKLDSVENIRKELQSDESKKGIKDGLGHYSAFMRNKEDVAAMSRQIIRNDTKIDETYQALFTSSIEFIQNDPGFQRAELETKDNRMLDEKSGLPASQELALKVAIQIVDAMFGKGDVEGKTEFIKLLGDTAKGTIVELDDLIKHMPIDHDLSQQVRDEVAISFSSNNFVLRPLGDANTFLLGLKTEDNKPLMQGAMKSVMMKVQDIITNAANGKAGGEKDKWGREYYKDDRYQALVQRLPNILSDIVENHIVVAPVQVGVDN